MLARGDQIVKEPAQLTYRLDGAVIDRSPPVSCSVLM